jgi:hypothetical protein
LNRYLVVSITPALFTNPRNHPLSDGPLAFALGARLVELLAVPHAAFAVYLDIRGATISPHALALAGFAVGLGALAFI